MRPEARQYPDRLAAVRPPTTRRVRADHWIYLDRTWAQWLGVRQTAGSYRIRGRELHRRLARHLLEVTMPTQVSELPQLPGAFTPQEIRRQEIRHPEIRHSA